MFFSLNIFLNYLFYFLQSFYPPVPTPEYLCRQVALEDVVGATRRPRSAHREQTWPSSHLVGQLEVDTEGLSLGHQTTHSFSLDILSLAIRDVIHLAGSVLVLFSKEEGHFIIATEKFSRFQNRNECRQTLQES